MTYNEYDMEYYNETLAPILEKIGEKIDDYEVIERAYKKHRYGDSIVLENVLYKLAFERIEKFLNINYPFNNIDIGYYINARDTSMTINQREIYDISDFNKIIKEIEKEKEDNEDIIAKSIRRALKMYRELAEKDSNEAEIEDKIKRRLGKELMFLSGVSNESDIIMNIIFDTIDKYEKGYIDIKSYDIENYIIEKIYDTIKDIKKSYDDIDLYAEIQELLKEEIGYEFYKVDFAEDMVYDINEKILNKNKLTLKTLIDVFERSDWEIDKSLIADKIISTINKKYSYITMKIDKLIEVRKIADSMMKCCSYSAEDFDNTVLKCDELSEEIKEKYKMVTEAIDTGKPLKQEEKNEEKKSQRLKPQN